MTQPWISLPTLLGALLLTAAAWAEEGDDSGSDSSDSSDSGSMDSGAEDDSGEGASVEAEAKLDASALSGGASSDKFASAMGPTGAGLSLSPEQKIRAWGELAFHTQDFVTLFSPMLGGGYKVTPKIEVELILPMALATYSVFDPFDGAETSETAFVIGDPYVGGNFIGSTGKIRYKVGGGFGLPLAPDSTGGLVAAFSALGARGFQEAHLWQPNVFSIAFPARVEYLMGKIILGGDGGLGIYVPTSGGGDTEFSLALSPGVGTYLGGNILVGARIPFIWIMSDDVAQFAFEPYGRYDLGAGFVTARFTLNIDEPFGFAFDSGRFWGLHVGGGASF